MGCVLKPTILVVDDDPAVRDVTAQILARAGYTVIEADGGVAAISLLSLHEVDILLTDIRMPGLSGFMVAEQARHLRPSLAVLFTTGFISRSSWDQRRTEAVLHKPYNSKELVSRIAAVLDEHAIKRADQHAVSPSARSN